MRSDVPSSPARPDLEALRRSEPRAPARARRPWLPRLTLAVLALGGLAAIYAVLAPVLFPRPLVTLRAVRMAGEGPGGSGARSAFVQAAGWMEADPFPVTVRPLVRGVVERLEVLEGQSVKKGETVLAVLRSLEIENALEAARAQLALRDAERKKAATALRVARSLLEQKIALRSAASEREGELATARAAVDRARARRKAAEAAREKAQIELEAQRDLEQAGQGTPTALRTAAARLREAEERVTELRFEEVRFVADLARIASLLELAREALEDPRDLQGDLDIAAAEAARAEAAWARAQTDLDIARRNHEHLTIRAPIDGVVMRLESAPGALVGPQGEFKGEGEGSGSTGLLNRLTGTVVTLYDPARLQARVDVPFAELPGIEPGTEVQIEAKALPGRRFEGAVDRLVREADITQAKLQVKVRVKDPDALLRPEMLCTARFLVKRGAQEAGGARDVARLLVPTEAVRGEAVFVFDPTGGGRARRVPVKIIRRDGAWTEIEGDLGLSAKVILEPVEDGQQVRGKE